MLMIRENTHAADSLTISSEMEGDAKDLDNHLLSIYNSSDPYV